MKALSTTGTVALAFVLALALGIVALLAARDDAAPTRGDELGTEVPRGSP